MRTTLLLLASCWMGNSWAQGGPISIQFGGTNNRASTETHIPTKKVIPYAHVGERDYVWSKRIWRTIDLREKMNYPLYYPLEKTSERHSLWHILTDAIMRGDLTAYKPFDEEKFIISQVVDGDQFKYPILPPKPGESDSLYNIERKKLVSDLRVDMVPAEPIDFEFDGTPIYREEDLTVWGNPKEYPVVDELPIRAQDIIEYHLKEDWFFDKQRSVMDVRIIGMAPVRYIKENGEIIGKRELFWVYFPEARYLLQNYFAYNPHNEARRMSFDDLFWKRKFSSYIYKESNVYDRAITDTRVGVDALLKSEEVKNQVFQFEHDVWKY